MQCASEPLGMSPGPLPCSATYRVPAPPLLADHSCRELPRAPRTVAMVGLSTVTPGIPLAYLPIAPRAWQVGLSSGEEPEEAS
jgi:hypothetical protein